MEVKALNCPSCGATVKIQAGAKLVYCPYCGTSITAHYDETEQHMVKGTTFTDERTGIPVGTAVIPEGWNTRGAYMEMQVDDITPFGTILRAFSPDGRMTMTSQYGEKHFQFVTKSMGSLFMQGVSRKNFLDPKDYLQEYASRVLNIQFQPKTFGSVATRYSQNRGAEAQKIIGRFNENARIVLPDIQCDFRLQNAYCDAVAMSGRFLNGSEECTLIIAADLFGLEYYDAAPMAALGRGITNGIGRLFGGADAAPSSGVGDVFSESIKAIRSGEEKGLASLDFYKGGGFVGVMKRQKEKMQRQEAEARMRAAAPQPGQPQKEAVSEPAFGHTRETGKPVDTIEWGAKRFYYAMGPASQEEDLLEKFMIFIGSYQQDPALNQRLEEYHQQVRMQEQANLSNANSFAMNSRAINMQRQAQISQTLSSTSDMIMDSWEKRQASQDRISQNWSQAIRGVDSYTTTDGRTVEHSVSSDHVYQNPYGDTVGVSGTGLSEDVMSKLGLTELEKKS